MDVPLRHGPMGSSTPWGRGAALPSASSLPRVSLLVHWERGVRFPVQKAKQSISLQLGCISVLVLPV